MRNAAAVALAALAAVGAGAAFWGSRVADGRPADSRALIARGAAVYADACASCHGARLEGAPDWRSRGPDGLLPAPPHDASGHTWHHGDAALFRIAKEGPAAVVGGSYRSAMPGFGDRLSDADIRAVLAFIRSTWPERERAQQAEISSRETVR
jgi:mono/diheme cytochrome c family protein